MVASTKNILVTGANGQLGTEIRGFLNSYPHFNFIFTDFQELDITNAESVEKALDALKPAFLLNCAAYTAVDKAEQEETQANRIIQLHQKF